MRTRLAALPALAFTALLALTAPALATTEGDGEVGCPGVSGWFVNPDEHDRKPQTTVKGMVFEGTDLIHHSTETKLADLKPGAFNLATGSATPDQPSFFSVEVRDPSGAYGTLRWDVPTSKWTIVIGAGNGATDGAFSDADPVKLLEGKVSKWGAFSASTMVTTFGVGYTKNPPGTVAVTVESVTFGGAMYGLACTPPTTQPTTTAPTTTPATTAPTTTPATTVPTTAPTTRPATTEPTSTPSTTLPTSTPSTTSPVTTTPVAGNPDGGGSDGGLPVTGAAAGIMGGIAMMVVGFGGLLVVAVRRRRIRFEG